MGFGNNTRSTYLKRRLAPMRHPMDRRHIEIPPDDLGAGDLRLFGALPVFDLHGAREVGGEKDGVEKRCHEAVARAEEGKTLSPQVSIQAISINRGQDACTGRLTPHPASTASEAPWPRGSDRQCP